MPEPYKMYDELEKLNRTDRIAAQIQKCLANELNVYSKSMGRGILTIAAVKLSGDRKNAKVYISYYGDKQKANVILESANNDSYRFQSILSCSLKLKRTPVLKFFLMESPN